ncbi:transcription factor spTFIIE alpha subunit [Metarhizium rileyi]|uniref:Transcription factor spTFIIE alpha subunit n=1 Tax=Metarhizium rileyi (strain RCEF 4871) TaxID=1649241 RepID=A0A162JP57_METRR|nr:transcription factor spTFIIE alpha subunit [Metarhizium rileyi RCEF 4871]
MDLAVTLIKSVMRAFYPTRDILVMDALILHEAIRDDDLAYLMAINTKDLHKICGKLREDRFITVSELRDGNPRPSNRTWYYINYRHTIDAIKWRVYTIDKEVQGAPVPANEKKEYFCSFCKAEWTAMEVLDSVGPSGFLCHRCHHTLTFEADRTSTGHEQSTRLNDQFKFISDLLPKIDAVHIPECDFDRALAKARPVVRDATHQRAATIAVESGTNRPMAVKGLTNTGPQSIAVNISTSDGPSTAEKEAEKARKEKIAHQNALPSWMSNSTVTGESFSRTLDEGSSLLKQDDENNGASKGKKVDTNTSAKIDDIFEKLKAEQAAEMAKGAMHGRVDEGFDSEEDDGDDDEFEDVPATGNTSSLGTPSTVAVNREVSIMISRDGDSADERALKKVKAPEGLEGDGDTGDEDEDMEFEDI